MNYRVDVAERAERDLKLIYRYIRADVSHDAIRWFNSMEKAILSLEINPERNPLTPENKKLRHLVHKSRSATYRIIFSINMKKRVVTVLHIRHGARLPLPKAT